VQTFAEEYVEPVVAKPSPAPVREGGARRRSRLPLLVAVALVGVGIAAAILALAAGLRPTKRHGHIDASGFVRPPIAASSPEPVSIAAPVDTTEALPQLHHPDGSAK
jgi:hypothetical protein